MEIKKLGKIHIVRTNDFKKEDYESLIDFIQAICEKENRKNIFISYPEYLTIPSSQIKNVKDYNPKLIQQVKLIFVLENIGFDEQNIEDYVNNYFTKRSDNPEYLSGIKEFLKHHEQIKSICSIPINLELLCNVYDPIKFESRHFSITFEENLS
jgi:hypothetical protein